jgi:PUA domain protein
LYYSGKEIIAIQTDNKIIPYLKYKNNDLSKLSSVIIDMPAVPFMTNGADLLRPGIVSLEEFKQGDLIIIRDEKNNIPLAVMQALFSSNEIKAMEKGKVAKSLHYVNDKYWKNN